MTLIKICGLTREGDAKLAIDLGADFVGFIFVKESPRFIAPENVRDICGAKKVGVFRNASVDDIHRAADASHIDIAQLHGDESDELIAQLQLPAIKVFNVKYALPASTHTAARYVMFDTGGGTGRRFDWNLLDAYEREKPFFLAGGITQDNVDEALRARPDAIDLASGVESAPGIKDHDKLKRLFERVKR